MTVRPVYATPAVLDNLGHLARARGSLVYAVEAADNPGVVDDAASPSDARRLANPLAEVPGLGSTMRIRAVTAVL